MKDLNEKTGPVLKISHKKKKQQETNEEMMNELEKLKAQNEALFQVIKILSKPA